MRKKSHISLARHIVCNVEPKAFEKHKKAFYVGSILPDCTPSFLTKRHEITGTFDEVVNRIEKLTVGYNGGEEFSTLYFTRLGELIHYIADYFTFPHNKEYDGTLSEHCVYEGQLKHSLRAYIKDIDKAVIASPCNFSRIRHQFTSVEEICLFIKNELRRYINRGIHSVEEDCKYIVGICSSIAKAILYLCQEAISKRSSFCIA